MAQLHVVQSSRDHDEAGRIIELLQEIGRAHV